MRWHVEQRMDFIAKTLDEKGYINRKDLMDKFGISTPQASIDLRNYSKLLPGFIKYNTRLKRYEETHDKNR